MQRNKKLSAVAVTTLLVLSMFAFLLPANAVITLAGGAAPATGPVGTKTYLAVTGSSPGAQVQTYWENLAGIVLGNASTYADAAGAVLISVIVPDSVVGAHSIIVRDMATGATAGATFTVTPAITLSATRGIPGDAITVTGSGFAASDNMTITFNGVDLTTPVPTISSATGNFTGGFVVPNLAYGDYPVVAADNETVPNASPAVTFTIGASVSITPTSGPSGTLVTATGRGFTKTAGLIVVVTIAGFPVLNTTTIRTNADGTFTGQFYVPSASAGFLPSTTRKTVSATDGTIVGTTSGTGSFRLTAGTTITVTPTSAAPGASVTLTGSGFAQTAGTQVNVLFGATPTGTFTVSTVNLADNSGNFTATVTVPNLPTTAYFFNCTDARGLNATTGFQIAITALFATPNSGPSGTIVTLTGFGFLGTTANITLGSFRMLTNAPVASLLAGTLQFTVPTVPAGTYTLKVNDDNLFEASTSFVVSATSSLTVSPTQAPVGLAGLTLVVRNFAQGETVDFFISNSTINVALAVTPVSGATVNGSLIFVGTFTVPALDLGAYTITANTTDGLFNATASFTIGSALIIVNTIATEYLQGQTVSFNIQSSFPYSIVITIKDPAGYPATTLTIPSGLWVPLTTAIDSPQVVPYAFTTYTLPNAAPTGRWTWTTMVGTSPVSGNFTVKAAVDPGNVTSNALNQTLTDIITRLTDLNGKVVNITGTMATINTNVGQVQTSVSSINGVVTSINGNMATITSSLGSVQTSLSSINGAVTQVSNGIATIQTDLGTVKTSLSNIDPVIGLIAGDTTTLKTSVGEITTSLSSLNTKVTGIEGDVATIQTDLGTLKGTVTSISGNVATIQTTLGTMQADISNLQTDLTSTKSTTEGLSPLIIVAIVLALIAAIAAIASIVLMRRKIAG